MHRQPRKSCELLSCESLNGYEPKLTNDNNLGDELIRFSRSLGHRSSSCTNDRRILLTLSLWSISCLLFISSVTVSLGEINQSIQKMLTQRHGQHCTDNNHSGSTGPAEHFLRTTPLPTWPLLFHSNNKC